MDTLTTNNATLTLQPIRESDYAEVVEVINASDRKFVGHNIVTLEELANDLKTFEADPETDTCVVRSAEGKIIAYADFWPGVVPHVRMFGFMRIHPDHKAEGAGTAITHWMESRASEVLLNAPPDLKVTVGQRAYANQPSAKAFLESCGYTHDRSSFRMTIELDCDIPEPVLPAGFTLVNIQSNEADLRRALQAQQEAFLDHYGVIEEPFEDYFKRESVHILGDAANDLSASYMALDGDQVAAVCINQTSIAGYTDSAWVGTLSVRRPWRKLGLGLALLRMTFRDMQQRGKSLVGLYVDAQNLTGALRLYEKAGMYVQYESCYYEKVLREGKDLANKG